ncbi:MAG: hypothetical protein AB1717_02740 [Pseudomonadota bacterium]
MHEAAITFGLTGVERLLQCVQYELLYTGILGYFASVDGSDQLTARANGDIIAYRLPSYGSFSATAQPQYWYGIVRSVSFPGVMMDVDRLAMHVEAKDGDKQQKLAYMKQVGAASSAFEHAVPERLFADPSKLLDDPSQPQGISAVKALAIAASQGQKIYKLTAHNAAYHANILDSLGTDADTKTEIANALNAGMEVTVHQADITANGWTGSGYIILDPETGAGAYKISGGANGGNIIVPIIGVIVMTIAFVPFVLVAAYCEIIVLSIVTAMIYSIAWVVAKLNISPDYPWRTFIVDIFGGVIITALAGAMVGITSAGLIVGVALSIIYAIFDAFVLAYLPVVRNRYA